MHRSSGILLHVSSLPGGQGVGDLGPAAYHWIDQLAAAKQAWWQVLPLGPTGYADSPYQCFSAFAGNPNLISLERLADEGLLEIADCGLQIADLPKGHVDFERVTPLKLVATEQAYERFKTSQGNEQFERFCTNQRDWLDDFALFVALKDHHGGRAWWEWPKDDRIYDPSRVRQKASELKVPVELCKFRQFLFYRQWLELRGYAHSRGVQLIGDMPIFVSSDS